MDGLERSITHNNISRFFDLLTGEVDPGKRSVLQELLISEENRFARWTERLDTVDQWLSKCDGHIEKIGKLLDDHRAAGRDGHETERLLKNLRDIKAILGKHREYVRKTADEF